MPKGPNGEWRPGDVVGCAVRVAKIATGEIVEAPPTKHQQDARKGGLARAETLSPERRREIATNGAAKRWEGK